jgi:hypothetical protein
MLCLHANLSIAPQMPLCVISPSVIFCLV